MTGHFTRKYSEEQKRALLGAVLDRGLTVKAAVRAGARGDLSEDPFAMHYGYAAELVRKERGLRQSRTLEGIARKNPEQALQEAFARLLVTAERELERSDLAGTIDLDRMIKLAEVLRKTAAMARALPQSVRFPADPDGEEQADFASRLARKAAQDAQTSKTPGDALATPDSDNRGEPLKDSTTTDQGQALDETSATAA